MKIIVSTALSVILLTGVFALQATKHKGEGASTVDQEMSYSEGEPCATGSGMVCVISPVLKVSVTDPAQVISR